MGPMLKQFIEQNKDNLDKLDKLFMDAATYMPVAECNELGMMLRECGIDIVPAAYETIKKLVESDIASAGFKDMETLNHYMKYMPTYGLDSFNVKMYVKDIIEDSEYWSVVMQQGQYFIMYIGDDDE